MAAAGAGTGIPQIETCAPASRGDSLKFPCPGTPSGLFPAGLSERRAADAVRGRIDRKYAPGLGLDDPGFDASVLCEFRARLVAGSAEGWLLAALLEACRGRGWLKVRGRRRTDATHVLACVRGLDRLECVAEALRRALNGLAVVAPTTPRAPSRPARRHARRPV